MSGKPIKFVGTGEKMDALEPFYPERMAQRILGMGDMLTLYEKAQEAIKVRAAKQAVQIAAAAADGLECSTTHHVTHHVTLVATLVATSKPRPICSLILLYCRKTRFWRFSVV